jgi:hypothetical protein
MIFASIPVAVALHADHRLAVSQDLTVRMGTIWAMSTSRTGRVGTFTRLQLENKRGLGCAKESYASNARLFPMLTELVRGWRMEAVSFILRWIERGIYQYSASIWNKC